MIMSSEPSCLPLPPGELHRIYGVGGADSASYGELLALYAHH